MRVLSTQFARRAMLAALAGLSYFSPIAQAQMPEGGSETTPLSAAFGAVGLIGEMNSAEHYGALQSRLAAYNANEIGDARLDTFVAPSNAIVSLSQNNRWFGKIGAVYVNTDGTHPGGSMPESTSRNFLLQLLYRPVTGTLIGVGVAPDRTSISIPVNDASIDAQGTGLRIDLLQRLGAKSGFAAKLVHLEGHSTFSRPLPSGQVLSIRSSTTRTYLETTLTTILDRARFASIPQGWSLRPVTHVLLQRDRRDQQGSITSNDFAQWLLTVRMQKDVFRAGQIGPYVEAGAELELTNDAAAHGSDDTLLYGKLGAAFLAGDWGRLDVYYARRQAPDGGFTSNTANLLLSMTF